MKDEWEQQFLNSHDFSTFLDKTCTLSEPSCKTCQKPFKCIYFIKKFIQEDHYSLIDDINDKVMLFMGH